ncbi:MAG: hypothetical protein HND52_13480 [Ignavibacteriae bacterium]|nr:hypothetical protein [Ignavibacteriota bacterium]NOG98965.1 hypothetical protein [Ignavibacteriota bacterium]
MLFLTSNIAAQQRQGPPPIPNETQINKMVDDLSNELSLSDVQKIEILALYIDHFADVKSLTNGQRPSREQMDKLKNEFEKNVRNKLNEEQKFKFEKYSKSQNKQPNQNRIRK